jgi:hypothetical protein
MRTFIHIARPLLAGPLRHAPPGIPYQRYLSTTPHPPASSDLPKWVQYSIYTLTIGACFGLGYLNGRDIVRRTREETARYYETAASSRDATVEEQRGVIERLEAKTEELERWKQSAELLEKKSKAQEKLIEMYEVKMKLARGAHVDNRSSGT